MTEKKSFFKNGYLRTALTVIITLLISSAAIATWNGLNGMTEDEAREEFVNKEIHKLQMEHIIKELEEIKGTVKEVNRKLDEH